MNQTFLTLNQTTKVNKSEISLHSSKKSKNEPQYEEILIPNWTYSTGQGVIYNPIIEKTLRIPKKNLLKKTKNTDSSIKFDSNLAVLDLLLSFSISVLFLSIYLD